MFSCVPIVVLLCCETEQRDFLAKINHTHVGLSTANVYCSLIAKHESVKVGGP